MNERLTAVDIINAVLDWYCVSATALMGRRRTGLLTDARMLATAILAEDLGMSPDGIAKMLRRDRTTVVYYLNTYRWRKLPVKEVRKMLGLC